jgi:hypothetical protein
MQKLSSMGKFHTVPLTTRDSASNDRAPTKCQIDFRDVRRPVAPLLPVHSPETSARPAGSSRMKLHRSPVLMEVGRCCPGRMPRHVRSHPRPIRWSTETLLDGRRRVPGPTPTRHPFKGRGFDDGPLEKPVDAQARAGRLRMRPGPRPAKARPAARNRMLTLLARRSAAIADAPEGALADFRQPGRMM